MVKKALIVALCLMWCSTYSYPIKMVYTVYNKLVKDNNLLNAPRLHIVRSSDANAWSGEDGISITTAMLRTVRNQDELARVLGHELGHHYLKHRNSSYAHEYAADMQAAVYMRNAHYNVCRGAALLKRRNNEGDADTHPADYLRWLRFGC